jgi:hypothetical protein
MTTLTQKMCIVNGCQLAIHARHRCHGHYRRFLHHGDDRPMVPLQPRCGYKRTSEYGVWTGMIQRCSNPESAHYERYGGRGIEVCLRWRNSFENFLADMGIRPSPNHQIDRRNNDGHYEPTNCRWTTPSLNCANRSTRRSRTGFKGVARISSGRFSASIKAEQWRFHIGTFDTPQEAAWMYDQWALSIWPDGTPLNLKYL